MIVVDQTRADYITEYGAVWKFGFRTLLEHGAVFRNARYPYLATLTCSGHATLSTGAYPHSHGMILNSWWDRVQGKLVECTDDAGSRIVSYGESRAVQGDSASNLLIPTLADEIKAQHSHGSRVVSFSYKARSAISLAGHRPDIVSWYEDGGWVTASAFSPTPLLLVAQLIAVNPIAPALEGSWKKLLLPAAYKYQDDAPEEQSPRYWSRTFPKVLKAEDRAAAEQPRGRYSLWEQSPLPDELLGRFARGALRELKLGRGTGIDYLAVSFSALDGVGHAYGPRSHEVQDVLARLDQVLGDLLAALDRQVGRDRYVLALSADHGVAVYPEQLRAQGEEAGRVPMKELSERPDHALGAEIGPGQHVANISYTDLYLAPGVLGKLKQKAGALPRVLDAIRKIPGVAAAFSTDELRNDPAHIADQQQRAATLGHYPDRSGDIVFLPQRNWIVASAGTTHGSQHDYDQHVPMILYGAGVKPGRYDRSVTPADLAPTLARLVGVKLGGAEGHALAEAVGASVNFTGEEIHPARVAHLQAE